MQYLYDNARIPAVTLEKLAWGIGFSDFSFCKCVQEGTAPEAFCESTDPNRLVPAFLKPEWIGIVVSGDPGRNHNRGYIPNHEQGAPRAGRYNYQPIGSNCLKRLRNSSLIAIFTVS